MAGIRLFQHHQVTTPSDAVSNEMRGFAGTGLLHYNANNGCSPLVFIQTFDSSDPGLLSVVNALAALRSANQNVVSAAAGNITGSPLTAFALDSACLSRCGLSSGGGDLSGLSSEMKARLRKNRIPFFNAAVQIIALACLCVACSGLTAL